MMVATNLLLHQLGKGPEPLTAVPFILVGYRSPYCVHQTIRMFSLLAPLHWQIQHLNSLPAMNQPGLCGEGTVRIRGSSEKLSFSQRAGCKTTKRNVGLYVPCGPHQEEKKVEGAT